VDTVGKELGVVVAGGLLVLISQEWWGGDVRSLAGSLSAAALDGNALALVLQALGSNQTLDLGGLGVLLLALLGDSAADDELADVVLLVEAEEAADLGGTLGAETLGNNGVGQTGELALTLLNNGQSENGQVQTGDGWKGVKLGPGSVMARRHLGTGRTYHHGWTCACAHQCGGGGSSCGRRRGADGYGWGGEL
jgi:hypothetical protein